MHRIGLRILDPTFPLGPCPGVGVGGCVAVDGLGLCYIAALVSRNLRSMCFGVLAERSVDCQGIGDPQEVDRFGRS